MVKFKRFLVICFPCLFLYFIIMDYLPAYIIEPRARESILSNATEKPVLIYFATSLFGEPYPMYNMSSCVTPCLLTQDRNRSDEADAWLYHNRDFDSGIIMNPNNKQIHIWHTSECPVYETIRFPPNSINWTLTYKKDSDIWRPYGYFIKKEKNSLQNFDNIWSKKSPNLTVTWLVSNCHTQNRRSDVVLKCIELGLKADIYGDCGVALPKCDKNADDKHQCGTRVLQQYFFYFAFENSNCVDYVTEKFFNSLRYYYTVPIVIQRKIYAHLNFPPKSFIALDDFGSIQEMVTFLSNLVKNKTEYLAYHEWRNYYEIISPTWEDIYCNICKQLKNSTTPRKSYPDLSSFYSMADCDNHFADKYL